MNPHGVFALLSAALGGAADRSPDWRDAALCTQSGLGDAWFPEKGGPVRRPKAICRRCPSRVPCLRFALEHGEQYGLWGGLSREEREPAARAYQSGADLGGIIDDADEQWAAKMAAASEYARSSAPRASAASARAAKAKRAAYRAALAAESPSVPQTQEAAA